MARPAEGTARPLQDVPEGDLNTTSANGDAPGNHRAVRSEHMEPGITGSGYSGGASNARDLAVANVTDQ